MEKKWITVGFILSSSLFLKPFGLIFLPYFALQKHYKALLFTFIFLLLWSLTPLLLFRSFEMTVAQYGLWIQELSIELSHKQGLLEAGNHTIFSLVGRYTPISYLIVSKTDAMIYQLSLLIIIGIGFLWFVSIGNGGTKTLIPEMKQVNEMAFLLALIPLLAYTSENAFIYCLPIALAVLVHFKRLNNIDKLLTIVALLFTGGNFSELTGPKLSQWINDASLISFGTLLFIYLLFRIRYQVSLNEG